MLSFPGPTELLLILIIVVMIFGAKRIPEIMGGIGEGIRSFKKSLDGETKPDPSPPTQADSSKEKVENKA